MSVKRIQELRALAEAHKNTHRSAKIIIECLDDIEKLTQYYSLALDAAYKTWPKRGQSIKKLKMLAGIK